MPPPAKAKRRPRNLPRPRASRARRRCRTRWRGTARRRSASSSPPDYNLRRQCASIHRNNRLTSQTSTRSLPKRFSLPREANPPRQKTIGATRRRPPSKVRSNRLATVRIYKVAELLGTTSQEVTALLKRDHGIEVKSASSTIEEVVARQFVERLARQRNISLPTGDIFAEGPPAKGKKPAPAKKTAEPPKPTAPVLPPPRLVKTAKPAAVAAPAETAEPVAPPEPAPAPPPV